MRMGDGTGRSYFKRNMEYLRVEARYWHLTMSTEVNEITI